MIGLAYAMLAQIDAISGIYTAFFPVFIYVIFGTSRHLSMGKKMMEKCLYKQSKFLIVLL